MIIAFEPFLLTAVATTRPDGLTELDVTTSALVRETDELYAQVRDALAQLTDCTIVRDEPITDEPDRWMFGEARRVVYVGRGTILVESVSFAEAAAQEGMSVTELVDLFVMSGDLELTDDVDGMPGYRVTDAGILSGNITPNIVPPEWTEAD